MEYKSGITSRSERKRKKWRGGRIVFMILLLSMATGLAAGFLYPGKTKAIAQRWERVQNIFSFIVLDRKPRFYSLLLEKNGKDYRLTANDILDISYRDEFVIKEVTTDVLFGGGVAVDVVGIGELNDFGKLMKGIDLVDKAVLTGGGAGTKSQRDDSLRITYRGDPIAA